MSKQGQKDIDMGGDNQDQGKTIYVPRYITRSQQGNTGDAESTDSNPDVQSMGERTQLVTYPAPKVPESIRVEEDGSIKGLKCFNDFAHALAYAGGFDSITGTGQGWILAARWMLAVSNSGNIEIHGMVCLVATLSPFQLAVTGQRKNVTVEDCWDDSLVLYLPLHSNSANYAKGSWRTKHAYAKMVNMQMVWRVAFLCIHFKWAQVQQCEAWERKMGGKIMELNENSSGVKAMTEMSRMIFMKRLVDFQTWVPTMNLRVK